MWGALALRYSNLPGEGVRVFASWLFVLASLGLYLLMPGLWRASAWFLGGNAVLIVWWLMIGASNDRDWVTDLERAPRAEVDGERVTIEGIRDFTWQNGSDRFVPRYYDDTFDLNQLDGVDLVICYWNEIRAIAHTILSFRFEDGRRVAISIEIRREMGESFSPLKGLFKQYELHYVVATESDVIRLRTNHRGERVFLYPTRATKEQARSLFLSYMDRLNELTERPEFYHTVFNNCTTNIVDHINEVMPDPVPFGGRILFNGYSDELAYDLGWIDRSVSYSDLREAHYISRRARDAGEAPDFSEQIRRVGGD